MHIFTSKQREFIKANIKGRAVKELTQLVNNHFEIKLGENQIRAYIKNHGLKSGLDCRFKKGHTTHNKGKKKYWIGGEETQFKKGNKPHNYLPVGTERVNGDDYVDIKIADPNKWKAKHILIWEEHNGPLPEGHCIIFGDRNNRNFNPNNLICVSRGQLATLNLCNLIQNDAELTRVAIGVVDIKHKISRRNKKEAIK